MMLVPRTYLAIFTILILVAFSKAAASQTYALEQFLDEDGMLDVPADFSGAIDPAGFALTSGPREAPRFSTRAAVDGEWKSFGGSPYGCGGSIHAIEVAPSGVVYLGGYFSSCEDSPASNVVAYDPGTGSFEALAGANGKHLDGRVLALAVADGDLYVGGEFSHADGQPASGVARFDGDAWHPLGAGIPSSNFTFPQVSAIAVVGTDIYVGGGFDQAGSIEVRGIARFDGSEWYTLGAGIDYGEVFALYAADGDLYVGGEFTAAGGIESRCVARWDGSNWHGVGSGIGDPGEWCQVHALEGHGDDIYAAGFFSQEGNNVARWDGSAWHGVGPKGSPGLGGLPRALAVAGGDLYASGHFEEAGGQQASYIARWDGSNWNALAAQEVEGLNALAVALAVVGDDVYVGGHFTRAGDLTSHGIARWDGVGWQAVGQGRGQGISGFVNAVAVMGSDVYVAGRFELAGGVPANNIARWDGSQWHSLGTGEENGVQGGFDLFFGYRPPEVDALAVIGSDLYVGGGFRYAGGLVANQIARWDGSAWHMLDSGIGVAYNPARALAVAGDDLYVGGSFSEVSGLETYRVARWDGSSWHAVGEGGGVAGGWVNALAVKDGELYAAGNIHGMGGVVVNNIARWDGNSWHALDSGLTRFDHGSGWVYALTVMDDDLYAGGHFDRAGDIEVNHVARWDGTAWHALGQGVAKESSVGAVNTLTAAEGQLYAGGDFDQAGDVAVGGIASWDGGEWRALGSGAEPGADGIVHALIPYARLNCFGSTEVGLYVGGDFGRVGGEASRGIAAFGLFREPQPDHIFCSRFELD